MISRAFGENDVEIEIFQRNSIRKIQEIATIFSELFLNICVKNTAYLNVLNSLAIGAPDGLSTAYSYEKRRISSH